MVTERLYSPWEAALELNEPPETIRRKLREGDIQGKRIFGRWGIPEEEIQRVKRKGD
jgi:hypothetical protein